MEIWDPNEESYHLNLISLEGKYRLIKEIGKGGFAIVFLAENIKTHQEVAIKIISREEISKNNLMVYLENELRLSLRFTHPNIVKVYDILYEEDYILIVMEYIRNGDILSFIKNYDTYSYERKINIVYEILEALAYLHSKGISHRDLKPENILLDEDYHPKLIDFGLSKENSAHLHSLCGTSIYMAPEVIRCNVYDGTKADIWSLGVIFNLIVSGKFPFSDFQNDAQIVNLISHGRLELVIEDTGVIGQVIRKALVFDPKMRETSRSLLEFIQNSQALNPCIRKRVLMQRKSYESSLPTLQFKNRSLIQGSPQRIKQTGSSKIKLLIRKRELEYI